MCLKKFNRDNGIINEDTIMLSEKSMKELLDSLNNPNLQKDIPEISKKCKEYVEYVKKTFMFQNRSVSVPNFKGFPKVLTEDSHIKLDDNIKRFANIQDPSLTFLVLNAMLIGYQEGRKNTTQIIKNSLSIDE